MEIDFLFRLFVAGVLGALIGVEREYRSKEAGYRTHFLVALGSALFMLVSQYGFEAFVGLSGYQLDPARLAAQVVSGISFIGAGTIIFRRSIVRGLTTAAGIWVTCGIGLAVGAGLYMLGIVATLLTLVGLEVLSRIFRNLGMRSTIVEFSTTDYEALKQLLSPSLKDLYRVVSYEMQESMHAGVTVYEVSLVIRVRNAEEEGKFVSQLMDAPAFKVKRVE